MSKPTKYQFVQMAGQYRELCAEYTLVYQDKASATPRYDRHDALLADIDCRRTVLRNCLNLYKREVSNGLPFVATASKTEYPNHRV